MDQDAAPLDERARRFLFRRRLGEGAFGVVWEAYDTERGARVALKALTRTEPSSLYLFKREFRALADIVHPNLVTLYELLSLGDRWFFTMEFIDGVDFIEHVRGPAHDPLHSRSAQTVTIMRSSAAGPEDVGAYDIGNYEVLSHATVPSAAGLDLENPFYDQPTVESVRRIVDPPTLKVPVRITWPPPSSPFRPELLRAALVQLAQGLGTLHDAGKLHRDIKPSNVLVAGTDRVVILDFGLITELVPAGVQRESGPIVGTPAYMSPEQSLGRPLTPASDWYSVGVMLYVALTGKLPFDGLPLQVLIAKQRLDPAAPHTVAENVPEDLESLCMDLLRRKADERPTGADVLARLGVGRPSLRSRALLEQRSSFVGRQGHMDAIKEAFAVTRSGRPSAAIVHGPSGMGKSALAQAFVRSLRQDEPEVLVLAGRCFPRESVPYKAIDNLIDELSIYLQQLSASRSAVLLPRSMEALLRIFPVLRQVEGAAPSTRRSNTITSEVELRRRAFAALRELFGRIAERKQVVLILDDMQWSDADSDALLGEILRGPDAPPLFVLATFRTDDVETTPLARTLRGEGIETRIVGVDALTFEEARNLSLRFPGVDEVRAEAIARESGGNPFFVEALADYVGMLANEDAAHPDSVVSVDLGDVFREKLTRLPPAARALLETVAVAGHPIPIIPAWKASGVALAEQSMLSLLLVQHLLRSRTDVGAAREEIEPYHDRIREAVLSELSTEAIRACHERIAAALEAAGGADSEVLASHYEAAGRMLSAGRHALVAANEAAAALAFDRAARLYRWALSLAPTSDDGVVRARLGDALANAGRGAEAADAYLSAARAAPSHEVLELRRKAAEQLLISGHVERGTEVIRMVLEPLGMKLPQSRNAAVVSFVASRARLRIRGLDFRERPAGDIPASELLRVDSAWAVAVGLSFVDSIKGGDFQARHLMLALDSGEPYRIARAMAIEVAYAATGGPKTTNQTAALIARCQELANRIRHPHAIALSNTCLGASRYLCGRWSEALGHLDRGAKILREQCTGVTWEIDTAEIFELASLLELGRWKELTVRYEDFVRNAQSRGDVYAESHVLLELCYIIEMARDQPAAARQILDHAYHRKKAYHRKEVETFEMHDSSHLQGLCHLHLYCGTPRPAVEILEAAWPKIRGAFLLEIYVARLELLSLRSRAHIACAAEPGISARERKKLLGVAEKDITTIEADQQLWPAAMAAMLRASAATTEGDRALALTSMERAANGYSLAEMEIHTAVARRRLGELSGGERGRELIEEGNARLTAQGIKNPDAIARMIAPGRWTR